MRRRSDRSPAALSLAATAALSLAAPSLAACHRDPARDLRAAQQPAAAEPSPRDPARTVDPSAAPAAGDPAAAPAAGDLAARVLAALPAESRARVLAAPVALLLPRDPALAAAATVTSGDRWAAASIRSGELTISVHATDVAHPPPANEPVTAPPRAHRARGFPATMQVNEGIRSLAWEEGSVSYALEIECFRPFEDARCTQDTHILQLADSLVRVGGGR